jgi:hypothetical protein
MVDVAVRHRGRRIEVVLPECIEGLPALCSWLRREGLGESTVFAATLPDGSARNGEASTTSRVRGRSLEAELLMSPRGNGIAVGNRDGVG